MKAVYISEPGGPEVLEVREVEAPVPGNGEVLIDVVADGASVGFLPPLSEAEALAYWRGVWAPGVTVWSVSLEGTLVGTVQVHEAHSRNGKHRAEIAKLMVHSDCRGRGIAHALMNVAEKSARDQGRTLLVLDTRACCAT